MDLDISRWRMTVTPPASVLTVSNLQPSTVAITKDGAGTLAVNHVRAGALTIDAGMVQILADGTAAGVSSLPSLAIAAAEGAAQTRWRASARHRVAGTTATLRTLHSSTNCAADVTRMIRKVRKISRAPETPPAPSPPAGLTAA